MMRFASPSSRNSPFSLSSSSSQFYLPIQLVDLTSFFFPADCEILLSSRFLLPSLTRGFALSLSFRIAAAVSVYRLVLFLCCCSRSPSSSLGRVRERVTRFDSTRRRRQSRLNSCGRRYACDSRATRIIHTQREEKSHPS